MIFFANRKIIKDVKMSMNYLMGYDGAEFIDKIWGLYPNLKKVAIEQYTEGVAELQIATDILTIIFPDVIFNLPEEEKLNIILALEDEDLAAKSTGFSRIISVFLAMVATYTDNGKLNETSLDLAVSEIIGACKNKGFSERQKDGIVKSVNKALFK